MGDHKGKGGAGAVTRQPLTEEERLARSVPQRERQIIDDGFRGFFKDGLELNPERIVTLPIRRLLGEKLTLGELDAIIDRTNYDFNGGRIIDEENQFPTTRYPLMQIAQDVRKRHLSVSNANRILDAHDASMRETMATIDRLMPRGTDRNVYARREVIEALSRFAEIANKRSQLYEMAQLNPAGARDTSTPFGRSIQNQLDELTNQARYTANLLNDAVDHLASRGISVATFTPSNKLPASGTIGAIMYRRMVTDLNTIQYRSAEKAFRDGGRKAAQLKAYVAQQDIGTKPYAVSGGESLRRRNRQLVLASRRVSGNEGASTGI